MSSFVKAAGSKVNFTGANLTGAMMSKIEISRSEFIGAVLVNADMSKGEFSRCEFRDADLTGANLKLANISRSGFTNSKLAGADLTSAYMYRSIITGVGPERGQGARAEPGGCGLRRCGDQASGRTFASAELAVRRVTRQAPARRAARFPPHSRDPPDLAMIVLDTIAQPPACGRSRRYRRPGHRKDPLDTARVPFTYPMVADAEGRLLGICVMRDLILAPPQARVAEVMLRDVVALPQGIRVEDALDHIKGREIPEYPVCDATACCAAWCGPPNCTNCTRRRSPPSPAAWWEWRRRKRVNTAIPRAIRSRLPWLMINLLTAFAAGAVVASFQETVNKVVLLATFLPVLAGQSGNTGAQALAIMVRTIGEHARTRLLLARAVRKELWLGLVHGLVTGCLVAAAIYAAAMQRRATADRPSSR